MPLFLKEMLKGMGDGEEILICLIRSHTLCDLKSQGVEQMCEHHRYLLASHGALDSCHSWRRVDAKTSSCAPGGAWGVEVCLWSQQSHRIIPGLLSCSREIPSTWNWGEEVELGLMALPELLAAVRVLLLDCNSVCAHNKRRKTEGSGFYQKLRGLLVEVDLQVWEGWHSWEPLGTPLPVTTNRRVLQSAKKILVLLAPDKNLLSPLIAANKSRIRKLTAAYTLWKSTVTTCKIYSLQYCRRWGCKIVLRGF